VAARKESRFSSPKASLGRDDGGRVHAVSLASRFVATVELESPYGHMYPTTEYLLIGSGEHLIPNGRRPRLEARGLASWPCTPRDAELSAASRNGSRPTNSKTRDPVMKVEGAVGRG
jgi:hypothetical protein